MSIQRLLTGLSILWLVAAPIAGAEPSSGSPATALDSLAGDSLVADSVTTATVHLIDGTAIPAVALTLRGDTLRVRTALGVRLAIPLAAVAEVRYGPSPDPVTGPADDPRRGSAAVPGAAPVAGLGHGGDHPGTRDPSYTRLMLAPTGRPLTAGERYVSDHYVLFPSYAWGLTSNLSLMTGVSVMPGLPLQDQVRYLAPRVSRTFAGDLAASVGGVAAAAGSGSDGGSAGMVYAMVTRGTVDASWTVGLGYGGARGDGEAHWLGGPLICLGGTRRLSEHVALVSESWFITGEGLGLGQQPVGVALRFFSGTLAADAGVVLIGDALQHGFPIPWLSFTYHLGP